MTDDRREADWLEAVRALPRNAAVIVRTRDPARREALARDIMAVAKRKGVRILIAADLGLAIRLRADGVHFPEASSARLSWVRQINPKLILTVSAHGPKGLVQAHRLKAHGAFLSPLFATASHPMAAPLGPVRWGLVSRSAGIPVLALGGVTAGRASHAVALGATGIAVIGAWIEDAN